MPFLESKFEHWITRERVIAGEDWKPMTDRGLIRAGISDTGFGYGHEYRDTVFGLIIACLSGVGRVLLDGEWEPIKPGMAYLGPPNTSIAYQAVEQARWEFAWVVYDRARAEVIFPMDRPKLISASAELLRMALEGLYHADLNGFSAGMIDTWSETVHQCALRIVNVGDVNTLAKLWSEVDSNPAHPWSLAKLCDAAGMSDEALRTLSLRETGRSPMRQVTHLRMRRASFLLRTTDLTLDSIAEQVGYQNAFAFSVAFKRWGGIPPSEHRARMPLTQVPLLAE